MSDVKTEHFTGGAGEGPRTSGAPAEVPTSIDSLKGLEKTVVFKEHQSDINGLAWSIDARRVVTSGDDDLLCVLDCASGSRQRLLRFPSHGCSNVRQLHAADSLLFCARKKDFSIRHFSLFDQKFLRFYVGHNNVVTHLVTSKVDDSFYTASRDATARFWDVREKSFWGTLETDEPPIIANDPDGIVLAVGVSRKHIRLYDKRAYAGGPFLKFEWAAEQWDADWTDLLFSPDGKTILITTRGNQLRVVDAFGGMFYPVPTIENPRGRRVRGSYSPCSKFVACGGADGRVVVWDRDSGRVVTKLESAPHSPIDFAEFNPLYHMMATAGEGEVKLWTPNASFAQRPMSAH